MWTCNKSLSWQKLEKEKKRERLVILGMLINIHELSSLAFILKITGLLSTVSSKLESAIVKEHRRASLCCIIVLYKHLIGYWFSVKGCRLDRILSNQRPRLPSITSLSRFFSFSCFCGERDLLQVQMKCASTQIFTLHACLTRKSQTALYFYYLLSGFPVDKVLALRAHNDISNIEQGLLAQILKIRKHSNYENIEDF